MKKLISVFLAFIAFPAAASFVENTYQGPVANQFLSVDKFTQNMSSLLPQTRGCLARAVANYTSCIIQLAGDSTWRGLGANNTGSGNSFPWSVPVNVAVALQQQGVPAEWNSWFGGGGSSADITYDTRITVGTSWTKDTAYHLSLGGYPFKATGSGTALAFTPKDRDGKTVPTDTCVVYYIQDTGQGSLSVDFNGGSATTQATAGTNSLQTVTITGARGNNTCNANWISGTVRVQGMHAFDSTLGQRVAVFNTAFFGATSVDWSNQATPTSPGNAISAIGASLVGVNLGINDWVLNTGLPTFQTNMQTIYSSVVSSADLLVVTPNPTNETEINHGTQQDYVDVVKRLAVTNNAPVADVFAREGYWGTNATGGSAGTMNVLQLVYDGHHPDRAGYQDMAMPVAQAIEQVSPVAGFPLNPLKVPDIQAAGFISGGTQFTVSGCSATVSSGGATAGIFTLGANSCTATVTLKAKPAPTGWHCTASDETAPAVFIGQSAHTATTASFSVPSGAGTTDVINFGCGQGF